MLSCSLSNSAGLSSHLGHEQLSQDSVQIASLHSHAVLAQPIRYHTHVWMLLAGVGAARCVIGNQVGCAVGAEWSVGRTGLSRPRAGLASSGPLSQPLSQRHRVSGWVIQSATRSVNLVMSIAGAYTYRLLHLRSRA